MDRLGCVIDEMLDSRIYSAKEPFVAFVFDCEHRIYYTYHIERASDRIRASIFRDSVELNTLLIHEVSGTWMYCKMGTTTPSDDALLPILRDMELFLENEEYHR